MTNNLAQWPGSTHESRIFDNSYLCALLESHAIQGHLVGDSGYHCRQHRLKKIQHVSHCSKKSCRGGVRCLEKDVQTKLDTTLAVIVALAVQYNFGERLGDGILSEFEVDN